jgi:hypothetical protein
MRRMTATMAGLVVATMTVVTAAPGWTAGYDYFNVKASADGVSVQEEIDNLLPVNQLLGPSSGSTEAHISRGGIGASAVAPNPGDLVLSAPGAAAGLAGIPNLPQYPAQAQAAYPATPTATFSLTPSGTIPVGRLDAEAGADSAESRATLGDLAQGSGTSGISVGSVKTHSTSARPDDSTFEAQADSQLESVQLFGGLLQIAEISTSVSVRIDSKGGSANPGQITVGGASLNGVPVAITDRGIEAPSGSTAVTPIVDALAKPLAQQGFSVHTTPAEGSGTSDQATASGAALVIEHHTTVNGFPAVTTISLGGSRASISVSGLTADETAAPADSTTAPSTSSADQSPPAPAPVGTPPSLTAGQTTGTKGSALPRTRRIPVANSPAALTAAPIDFRPGYPPVLAGGLFLLAAYWWMNRRARPGALRASTDLRSLWRW